MCFRNPGKRFAIEDLVAACNEAIYEFTGKEEGFKKKHNFTRLMRKGSPVYAVKEFTYEEVDQNNRQSEI